MNFFIKYFLLLLIPLSLFSGTLEEINLDKRLNIVENKVLELEKKMVFINENLKRIDKNFQILTQIINNETKYDHESRVKPVKDKHLIKINGNLSEENSIYELNEDTYLYSDKFGQNIIGKIYVGEIVDLENCPCNLTEHCLCKIRNRNVFINVDKLKK